MTREARRNAILDAATVVFAEKGFDAARMDDVAAGAGIAKGLLYKHFESKDALFEALVDRQGRQYVGELRGALATASPEADPVQVLSGGLAIWLRQVSGDKATFQLHDPGSHRAYEDLRDRMREVIVEVLLAVEPTADVELCWLTAAAIQGAAESVGFTWRARGEVIPLDAALTLLSGFCWGGLSLLQETQVPGPAQPVS